MNIRFADPESAAPNPRFVVAISAGPNNILETDLDRAAASNAGAGGDDIIGRIK